MKTKRWQKRAVNFLAAARAVGMAVQTTEERAVGFHSQGTGPSSARTLKNVAVISTGEALGHGVWTDEAFVDATVDLINTLGAVGLKSRFGHPGMCSDAIGTELGRFRDASKIYNDEASKKLKYDVYQCVADFYPMVTANNTAQLDHIFQAAELDPAILGTSVVFIPGGLRTKDGKNDVDSHSFGDDDHERLYVDNPLGLPHETLSVLMACDFVSDPASNPTGLYSIRGANTGDFSALIYSILKREPEALERASEFLASLRANSTVPTTTVKHKTLSGKTTMKFWQRYTAQKGKKKFAEATASDGTILDVPVDDNGVPTLGGTAAIMDGPDPAGPAPEGAYDLDSGYTITVNAEGIITAVALTDPAAAAPVAANSAPAAPAVQQNSAPVRPAAPVAQPRAAALDPNIQAILSQQAQFSSQLSELTARLGGPAAQPIATTPDADPTPQNGSGAGGRRGSGYATLSLDNLRELMHMYRAANNPFHPEHGTGPNRFSFTSRGVKRFATTSGTSVTWDTDLITRAAEYLPDLFTEFPILEDLEAWFTIVRKSVSGNGSVTVRAVDLHDTDSSYLKPGIGCTPSTTGASAMNYRSFDINPWHYYREWCPKEQGWNDLMNNIKKVNGTEIPFEVQIMDLIMRKIKGAFEQCCLTGSGVGSPFDGIITQMLADPAITPITLVAANVNTDTGHTTAANPINEFRKMETGVPDFMQAFAIEQEALVWMLPQLHYQNWCYYAYDARQQFTSDAATDFSRIPNTAYPAQYRKSFRMTNAGTYYQIITNATNLLLGLSDTQVPFSMTVETAPKTEGKLKVLIEGHGGVGYGLSERVTFGTT